jgi:hypothetical protein
VGALRSGAVCLWALACAACTAIGDPEGSGRADARPVGPADAAIAAPDGAPSAVTLLFGETDDADVTAVTVDTYLDSANPTLNYGAEVTARVDADPARVALLRFDVSAIAPGATVTAAELAVTTAADALEEGTVQLYEVTESWAEGDAVATAAPANWTQRTTNNDWTTAGAGSGSRAPAAMSEVTPSIAATRYPVLLPIELVQGWVADPASNRGLVLVPVNAATHGVDFESSESATTAARPSLSITFIPSNEP